MLIRPNIPHVNPPHVGGEGYSLSSSIGGEPGGWGRGPGAHRVARQKNGKSYLPPVTLDKGRVKTSRKTMIYGLSLMMRLPSVHPYDPSPLLFPFSSSSSSSRERGRSITRSREESVSLNIEEKFFVFPWARKRGKSASGISSGAIEGYLRPCCGFFSLPRLALSSKRARCGQWVI